MKWEYRTLVTTCPCDERDHRASSELKMAPTMFIQPKIVTRSQYFINFRYRVRAAKSVTRRVTIPQSVTRYCVLIAITLIKIRHLLATFYKP